MLTRMVLREPLQKSCLSVQTNFSLIPESSTLLVCSRVDTISLSNVGLQFKSNCNTQQVRIQFVLGMMTKNNSIFDVQLLQFSEFGNKETFIFISILNNSCVSIAKYMKYFEKLS